MSRNATTAESRPLTGVVCNQSHAAARHRHDPTRTKTLRDQYGRQLAKRYRYIKGLIRQGVAEEDRLGLRNRQPGRDPGAAHANDEHDEDDGEGGPDRPEPTPTPDAELPPEITDELGFDFPQDEAKIHYFSNWVDMVQDDLIADPRRLPSEQWGAEYIGYSYEKGLEHARTALEERDLPIPESAMGDAFNLPIHRQTLENLYARNFKALDGLTADMGREISDVLAEGLLEGVNPRVMATRMNERIDKVGITRSRVIARTEIIRSHNEAALSRYERHLGSDADVTVVAEFTTADDNDVCDLCLSLEGKRFSLKEARNMIPGKTHPNCRCTWVPVTRNI